MFRSRAGHWFPCESPSYGNRSCVPIALGGASLGSEYISVEEPTSYRGTVSGAPYAKINSSLVFVLDYTIPRTERYTVLYVNHAVIPAGK